VVNSTFQVFPAGASGAALLLLRVSASLLLVGALVYLGASPVWAKCGVVLVAVALCTGFRTRFAAWLCALLAAAGAMEIGGALGVLVALSAVNAAALALLGAGAFSIDALLFGRRVISLDG
jgi:hypothetical protein